MTPRTRTHADQPALMSELGDILDELEVAGGELVITCEPGTPSPWSAQVITDVDQDGLAQHRGQMNGDDLEDTLVYARAELQADQDSKTAAGR